MIAIALPEKRASLSVSKLIKDISRERCQGLLNYQIAIIYLPVCLSS